VALDLPPQADAPASRLLDLAGSRLAGRLPPEPDAPAPDPSLARVPVLPVEDLPSGVSIGVVTAFRSEIPEVVTLGGRGIYVQEAVARSGPWLVLRVRRP
jgi:hypothetical protein